MQRTENAALPTPKPWPIALRWLPVALCLALPTAGLAQDPQAAFHAENADAMQRMMRDMHQPPSGDVDRDFAAMMIAHHQGAIDMALAELRHGRNEQLRRLAQEIIVTQRQEIAAMRQAITATRASEGDGAIRAIPPAVTDTDKLKVP